MLGRAAGRNSYSPYAAGRRRTGTANSPKRSLDSLPRSPSVRLTVRGWWEGAARGVCSALISSARGAAIWVASCSRAGLEKMPRCFCLIGAKPAAVPSTFVSQLRLCGDRGVRDPTLVMALGHGVLGGAISLSLGAISPLRNQGSVCLQQFCTVCYWWPGRRPQPRSAKDVLDLDSQKKRKGCAGPDPAVNGAHHPRATPSPGRHSRCAVLLQDLSRKDCLEAPSPAELPPTSSKLSSSPSAVGTLKRPTSLSRHASAAGFPLTAANPRAVPKGHKTPTSHSPMEGGEGPFIDVEDISQLLTDVARFADALENLRDVVLRDGECWAGCPPGGHRGGVGLGDHRTPTASPSNPRHRAVRLQG